MYDIDFTSNDPIIIESFKRNKKSTLEVKIYGNIISFIRWAVDRTPSALVVNQTAY